MAGIRPQDIDPSTGMITAGPYAGHTLEEVTEYLEAKALQAPAKTGGDPATPPAGGTPAEPLTPEQQLAAKSSQRVDGLAATVEAQNARFEADDEAEFAATVKDYDTVFRDTKLTIRQLVANFKKSLAPAARIQKGLHRQLYMMVKQQDPDVQRRIFEEAPPAETPPAPPAEPSTPPATPPPPPPKVPPVAAPPTPPGRPAPPPSGEKKSKLTGNHKTEAAARSFGITHDAYLLRLEENGQTQESLDAMTINRKVAGTPGRRQTVYDR